MPESVGFFTDTTVCIGCKACQVACHQWNNCPPGPGGHTSLPVLSGNSYDNTGSFSDVNGRTSSSSSSSAPIPTAPRRRG